MNVFRHFTEMNIFFEAMNDSQNISSELISSFEKNVYILALSMVNDRTLALDITQEVFAAVYRLPKKNGNDSSQNFLYSTCRSLCRKKKASTDTDFTENYALRAIKMLPEKYRSVIFLNDVASLTISELSEMLDISEYEAENRLRKGRTFLVNILKKQI